MSKLEVSGTNLVSFSERKSANEVDFAVILMELVVCCGSVGVYRGWFPVMISVCCSNFVYFYVFNGLKAIAYKDAAKPYPVKDLLLAFFAGKHFVSHITTMLQPL